jgi:hypothetical protein
MGLQQEPVTVTTQTSPRSTGGKHDFFSEGDYWWPNPVSVDSPYIQKDGMTNPDNFVAHRHAMIRLSKIVGALASAYKLTGDERYVQHALKHCKAWFVDTATLMNPNLLYAQAIKGRFTGRGIGIIDTIQLMEVVQGLIAMLNAKAMSTNDLAAIRNWFDQYLQSLTTHRYGKDEMNAENNHGTCWVMQVAAFAKFTGNQKILDFCSDRYKNVLLPNQMAADGSFSKEIRRTKPYGYSIFNLDAMTMVCQILSTKENDLWNYQTTDSKSIKKGIDFLYPYLADKNKWPFQKDVMYWENWPVAQPALVFGAIVFYNRNWIDTWKKLDHDPKVEEVIRNLPIRHPLIWLDAPLPVTQDIKLPKIFADAEQQTKLMLNEIPKASAATHVTPGASGNDIFSPRTLDSAGNLKLVTSRDWTSGFFPGVLWFLYEYTGKKDWLSEAQQFTAQMEREKVNGTTHDMGFKIYSSFGAGFRLTKNADYKNVIIESAKTLSKRFNENAGVLRSWDHSKQKWDFPVIIDNMMNLELLFAATRLTGDSSFYRIAVRHANTTMKNHYRADYSSYHVVDYDSTVAGKINNKTTHQGFSNESAWSRGQAWGLYGYTMCYRETKNKTYLDHADKIAAFILHHPNLPKDMLPYWDFNAPNIPNEPRDASAAAIMASSLYELSLYSKNGKEYKKAADKIMESLTKYYRAPIGQSKGFILLHSTGSKASNSEVDVPLNYADYYYIEALLRMKKLNEGRKNLF